MFVSSPSPSSSSSSSERQLNRSSDIGGCRRRKLHRCHGCTFVLRTKLGSRSSLPDTARLPMLDRNGDVVVVVSFPGSNLMMSDRLDHGDVKRPIGSGDFCYPTRLRTRLLLQRPSSVQPSFASAVSFCRIVHKIHSRRWVPMLWGGTNLLYTDDGHVHSPVDLIVKAGVVRKRMRGDTSNALCDARLCFLHSSTWRGFSMRVGPCRHHLQIRIMQDRE